MTSKPELELVRGLPILNSLNRDHLYLETFEEVCVFHPTDVSITFGAEPQLLTREQMYKLSDEIRTIADSMDFLPCDGSENE